MEKETINEVDNKMRLLGEVINKIDIIKSDFNFLECQLSSEIKKGIHVNISFSTPTIIAKS